MRTTYALALGLLCSALPWVAVAADVGGDIPRYMVLPGFWAAWAAPVKESTGFVLMVGVNAALWSLFWLLVLRAAIRPRRRSGATR
jgi:hypothetical protein